MNKESYQELLKDPRWIKKRNEILTRDKNTCRFCGAQDRYLHVHHKDYFNGFLPWEYPNHMLVTLCNECHKNFHEAQKHPNDEIKIGQLYNYDHSDFTNTAIVYHIDYLKGLIYTLECDDGASVDSIYDECNTFEKFKRKYKKSPFTIWVFEPWFRYISNHLELTPMAFRYNYDLIIERNPFLKEVLDNDNDCEYGY